MRKVAVHSNSLPVSLFRRLVRAVREVGGERLKKSYVTNFWFPLDTEPGNLVEEVISRLCLLARPGPRCIGVEWWLGRLACGQPLSLHFDRDMTLQKQTGQVVHPLWSSILYLNRFPSSPTVILDQVWNREKESLDPPVAKSGKAVYPEPNQYVVYRGNLYHGVMAEQSSQSSPAPAGRSRKPGKAHELRLTLLINYWDRRPLPPVCRDYDGTTYAALREGYPEKNLKSALTIGSLNR